MAPEAGAQPQPCFMIFSLTDVLHVFKSRVWWHTPVILVLRRQRQEVQRVRGHSFQLQKEFEVSLGSSGLWKEIKQNKTRFIQSSEIEPLPETRPWAHYQHGTDSDYHDLTLRQRLGESCQSHHTHSAQVSTLSTFCPFGSSTAPTTPGLLLSLGCV